MNVAARTPCANKRTNRPPSRLRGLRRRRRRSVIVALAVFALGVAGVSADAKRMLAQESPAPVVSGAEGARIATPRFAYEFAGTPDVPLERPVGVCVAGGTVFVTDSLAGHVVAFRGTGVSASTMGGERLEVPVGIACDEAAEELVVVDRAHRALLVFGFDGSFIETITPVSPAAEATTVPSPGAAEPDASAWAPVAVAYGDDGTLHVTDTAETGHRVWHLTRSGEVVGVFPPAAPGHRAEEGFDYPNGVVARDGRVWVADSNNRRLVEIAESGEVERSIPLGRLIRGLALLPDDGGVMRPHFALIDAFSHEVILVNDVGSELGRIGGPGSGGGALSFPNDVAVSGEALYIADTGNARIQVFEWAPPASLLEVPMWPGGPSWPGLLAAPLLLAPLALVRLTRAVRVVASREALDALRGLAQVSWGWRPVRLVVTPAVADGARRRPGPAAEVSEYSPADAAVLDERFELGAERSAMLSLAIRHGVVLTEDPVLATVSAARGVDVLDVAGFIDEFAYVVAGPDRGGARVDGEIREV